MLEADVEEGAVAVEGRGVARDAAPLARKQRLPLDGGLRDRTGIALLVPVPGRVVAHLGAEIGGQGLRHVLRRGLAAEHRLKLAAVAGHGVQKRRHLGGVGADLRAPGGGDLALQRGGPAIPVPGGLVAHVVKAGRVARVQVAVVLARERLRIGPAQLPVVATLAGHLPAAREARVDEQLLAQRERSYFRSNRVEPKKEIFGLAPKTCPIS